MAHDLLTGRDMGKARRPRVLVIDDDATMRELVVSMLDSAGFDGEAAADADEALSALQARPYEVVVCDVHMPRRDGFAFVRTARRVRPGTPVVLMSSFGGDDTRHDAAAAGADGFVAKPFSISQLREAVRAALGKRVDVSAPN